MLAIGLLHILPEYEEFSKIFFKKKANELPMHRMHDYSIELEDSGNILFGSFHNLSGNELKIL